MHTVVHRPNHVCRSSCSCHDSRRLLPSPRVDGQACFIGHSFGSIVVSWLVNNVPECVGSILLLDPVSVMLQEPDVAHNFLYRSPDQGSMIQAFFKYFVATELHVRFFSSASV